MCTRLGAFTIGLTVAGISISAQTPAPGATTSGDYSQEAFVIEQMRTAYRFENDGTGTRENVARIKVQSDFRQMLPVSDAVGARLVRRGALGCSTDNGKDKCSFIVFPLSSTKPGVEN